MPNHHETRPNLTGLSPVQQTELKSILARKWPALKPLPVFKFETSDHRLSIDFDKTHGEWVCRKTSFPSNNVLEMRGSLAHLLNSLPEFPPEWLAETTTANPQSKEFDSDAARLLEAIQQWTQNFRNGALYSGLREHLSESQQANIEDCIRFSLTARQLQVNPKNIDHVFDALSKAGGLLATLIASAQRIKTARDANLGEDHVIPEAPGALSDAINPAAEPARAFAAAAAASNPAVVSSPAVASNPAGLSSSAVVQPFIAPVLQPTQIFSPDVPQKPIQNVFTEPAQIFPPELIPAKPIPPVASQSLPAASPGTPFSRMAPFSSHSPDPAPIASLRRPLPAGNLEPPQDQTEHRIPRIPVLEISGFQLSALTAAIFFAVLIFTFGLTARLKTPAKKLQNAQVANQNPSAPSAASAGPTAETSSSILTLPPSSTTSAPHAPEHLPEPDQPWPPEKNPSGKSSAAAPPATAPPGASRAPETAANRSLAPVPSDVPTDFASRNAPSTGSVSASRNPAITAAITPAPRDLPLISRSPLHSSRSAAVLVTPAYGGKPFRVNFPEKTITANSSFAMSSQLSVVVSPRHAATPARTPSRLQPAELLSFAWPRFPKSADPYGLVEVMKVRATIAPQGRATNIKLLSGSPSLLPATITAIRQWRYKPALLNKTPVPAEQEITIEFRPPQYLSHLTTQRFSPK